MDELIKLLYKDARTRYAEETGQMVIDRINKTADELSDIESSPDEEQIDRLFELIKNHVKPINKTVNFELLKELLKLRYEYYLACEDVKDDTLQLYKHMAEKPILYYAGIVGEGSKFDIKLNFTLNPFRSKQGIKRDLELFGDAVMLLLNYLENVISSSDDIIDPHNTPILVFCKEAKGNSKSWMNKIANWRKCLFAYNLQQKDGLNNTQIAKQIGIYVKDDINKNYLKTVREYLEEAQRLINSAEAGTFPL